MKDIFLPFILMLSSAIGGAVVILLSSFLGKKSSNNAVKNSPYESGILSEDIAYRPNFYFYIFAIVFVIFDIEILLTIIWAFYFHENMASFSSIAVLFFTLMPLLIVFLHLVRIYQNPLQKNNDTGR